MDPHHIWDRRRGDLNNACQFESPTLVFVVVRTAADCLDEPLVPWVSSWLDPFIAHWLWLRSPPRFADYRAEPEFGGLSYLYGELQGECNEDEYLLLQLLLDFSAENAVAIHIWHLVYREMVAVLCLNKLNGEERLVNRLWLKEGEVIVVDEPVTPQKQLPFHRAIDSVRSCRYEVKGALTREFILLVTVYGKYNLGTVYNMQLSLPADVLTLILAKPWLIGQATQTYRDLGKLTELATSDSAKRETVAVPLATVCEAHVVKLAGSVHDIETIVGHIIQTGLEHQPIPKLLPRRNPRETLQNILIKDNRLARPVPENPKFIDETMAGQDDYESVTDRFATLLATSKFEDLDLEQETSSESENDTEDAEPPCHEFRSQMHRIRSALENTEFADFDAFLHQTFGTQYNDDSDYLSEDAEEEEKGLEIVDVDDSLDAVIYRDFGEERAEMARDADYLR